MTISKWRIKSTLWSLRPLVATQSNGCNAGAFLFVPFNLSTVGGTNVQTSIPVCFKGSEEDCEDAHLEVNNPELKMRAATNDNCHYQLICRLLYDSWTECFVFTESTNSPNPADIQFTVMTQNRHMRSWKQRMDWLSKYFPINFLLINLLIHQCSSV